MYQSVLNVCRVVGRRPSILQRLSPACVNILQCRLNHYDTLGVKKEATQQEIRAAFLKLSKKYHPDLNKNDPRAQKKFVNVSEAYEILSKIETRQKYDIEIGKRKPWEDEYPSHLHHPDFQFARDLRYGRQYYDPEFAENLKRETEEIKAMRKKYLPMLTVAIVLLYFIMFQYNKALYRKFQDSRNSPMQMRVSLKELRKQRSKRETKSDETESEKEWKRIY